MAKPTGEPTVCSPVTASSTETSFGLFRLLSVDISNCISRIPKPKPTQKPRRIRVLDLRKNPSPNLAEFGASISSESRVRPTQNSGHEPPKNLHPGRTKSATKLSW